MGNVVQLGTPNESGETGKKRKAILSLIIPFSLPCVHEKKVSPGVYLIHSGLRKKKGTTVSYVVSTDQANFPKFLLAAAQKRSPWRTPCTPPPPRLAAHAPNDMMIVNSLFKTDVAALLPRQRRAQRPTPITPTSSRHAHCRSFALSPRGRHAPDNSTVHSPPPLPFLSVADAPTTLPCGRSDTITPTMPWHARRRRNRRPQALCQRCGTPTVAITI
jgi:hypothetical protein